MRLSFVIGVIACFTPLLSAPRLPRLMKQAAGSLAAARHAKGGRPCKPFCRDLFSWLVSVN